MRFLSLFDQTASVSCFPLAFSLDRLTYTILATGFIVTLPISAQAASALPDAGTVLQEVPQVQPKSEPQKDPTFFNPAEDAQQYSDDSTPILIRQVEIQGNTVFTKSTLQALVAGLENRTSTLGELQRATAQITQYYRQHGYFLARAYLPRQQLTDGHLNIQILEGNLGQVLLDNQSRVNNQILQRFTAQIPLNQPLQEKTANRTLLLISDLAGIAGTQASLKAGQHTGQTDLALTTLAGKSVQGRIGLDNYGSSYTGQYRLSGYLQTNSLLGYGEQFSAQVLASNQDLTSGGINVQLPANGQGLMLGAGISRTDYELGKQFAILDAKGQSDNYNLNLSYPFIRKQDKNLNLKALFEYRKLWDEIAATETKTDKHAQVERLQLSYNQRDQWGLSTFKGGFSQLELTASFGQLEIESPSALNIDRQSAKTNGHFQKLELSFSRQQVLANQLTATAQLYGQLASKNLDSSEKFSFNQMRAYPSAEGLGDEGWGATVNIYYQLSPYLNAYIFKDLGHIYQNKDHYIDEKNRRYLASTGFGFGGSYQQLDYNASIAWRDTVAAMSDKDKNPRVLMQAGWRF
ncbi:MAG: ShlB/FhaC/HecB family hemolysin secretion/activation protein [Moraxellaceae bacterium]|nr:MAG: ShlB/FhaC/HecB family hemolysin secretion/activation protein [Moraxellaceae bacterium]